MNGIIPPLHLPLWCAQTNFLYIGLEIFALQGIYTAWFSNYLPKFR